MAWYEYDPQRLLIERKAMALKFPQFQLLKREDAFCWLGTPESNRGNKYEILVEYPEHFPNMAPSVFPVTPGVNSTDLTDQLKHHYPNGKLCLYYPGDRTFSNDTTAATVVVTAAWFFPYEAWLESGKRVWPGQELDHMQI
ncbi:MAG: hypothetical protein J0I20_30200 [Chloroflexi bacterium]|nr:hypothetical protein [Chloroflexota bacterium]MBN9396951.1 hypothetical protein [Candidatus Melainabacteria bacterium]OJV92932.1 MAG: hypothetical protein BGO39_03170 [Chloroflexi bacterium 54-19]